MNNPDSPWCTIVAGPNGAGKTTFAMHYLPTVLGCRNFINADAIAAGLSPLAPEHEQITASRLFLQEIERYIHRRESFAFETTLSGRTYLRLIKRLQTDGWKVALFYLWLPDVEISIARVKERVEHGGHHIPEEDIRRRFPRSINNLLNDYATLCDVTLCFNNSVEPELIFTQRKKIIQVENQTQYEKLLESTKHEIR
jgi:predicted ABC-type ATPase